MSRTLLTHVAVCIGWLLVLAPAHAQDPISIEEARNAAVGTTVTIEGTVTRAFGAYARIQDASGPTGASAIAIRQTDGSNSEAFQSAIADGTIQPGTTLRLTGATSEFNGLLQINNDDLESYEVVGQGEAPAPQSVTLADIQNNGEDYESELVTIDALSFVNASGTFANGTSYDVTDGETTLVFRVQGDDESALGGEPIPAGLFTYTGVIGQFTFDDPDANYQLIPIRPTDLAETSSVQFGRTFSIAQESADAQSVNVTGTNLTAEVSVTASIRASSTADGADVTGFSAPATLTLSPSAPTATLSFDPVPDEALEGVERLEVALSSSEVGIGSPSVFTLWILDNAAPQVTLYPELEGQALRAQLRQDFGDPPTLGLDRARDSLYAAVFNESGVVRGLYTGFEATLDPDRDPSSTVFEQGINAEHLWPQSKGSDEEPARSNLHILAPAWEEANAARCNYPYADIADTETERWFGPGAVETQPPPESERDAYSESVGNSCGNPSTDGRFEPREAVKGDAARAALYFRTIYPNRASLSFFGVQRDDLLDWNAADPADSLEARRNIIGATLQGNRLNPFVLDSTLARRAFTGDEATTSTIAEARDQPLGAVVTIEGTVTRAFGAYARVQDTSGPTGASAIAIRQTFGANSDAFQSDIEDGTIEPGTTLRITGVTSAFRGLLQINNDDLTRYEIVGQGDAPAVQSVTLADLQSNGEDYESELVEITDLTFADASGTFQSETNYDVTDGTATLVFRVQGTDESALGGEPIPEGAFTYTGVTGQFSQDAPDEGYQLIPVRPSDIATAVTVPDVISYDIDLAFGGAENPQNYRLVALPGAVDQPLAGTLSGSAGTAWQAYWDSGAASDYLVQFDGSGTFTFRPGNGFWLISQDAWTPAGEVESVALDAANQTSIALHPGWNIISNPFDTGIAWSAVEAANGGTLQPLWRFGGSFQQASTFLSADNGEAFYFLNNDDRDALQLPYPELSGAPARKQAPEGLDTMALTARFADSTTSAVQVGFAPDAQSGLDPYDWFAPATRFNTQRLRLQCAACSGARTGRLVRDVRPAPGEGQAFDLVLSGSRGTSVTLAARDAERFVPQEVVLLDPASGRTYDLQRDSTATIALRGETMALRLLIGTSDFVQAAQTASSPDRTTLFSPYPNPFRNQTRIEYTLPETRDVRVAVYDALGRRVRVLVDQQQAPGRYDVRWDGTDATNRPAASGLYLVRLEAGSVRQTRKVVLVR